MDKNTLKHIVEVWQNLLLLSSLESALLPQSKLTGLLSQARVCLRQQVTLALTTGAKEHLEYIDWVHQRCVAGLNARIDVTTLVRHAVGAAPLAPRDLVRLLPRNSALSRAELTKTLQACLRHYASVPTAKLSPKQLRLLESDESTEVIRRVKQVARTSRWVWLVRAHGFSLPNALALARLLEQQFCEDPDPRPQQAARALLKSVSRASSWHQQQEAVLQALRKLGPLLPVLKANPELLQQA